MYVRNLSKNSKISSVKISCHGILHQQQISACWKLIGIIILNFITNTSLLFHISYGFHARIHRPLAKVRGFTRETLIGVTADIETRLWRHSFNTANQIPPEHPRSSTTDDVECFFSVLRDCVGKNFKLKQVGFLIHYLNIHCEELHVIYLFYRRYVRSPPIFLVTVRIFHFIKCIILCHSVSQVYYEWRKITSEFLKRMDPTLPFYYFTSAHQRFYKGELPSFNQPKEKVKTVRAPRRELLISSLSRRATLPVRSSLSVHATFHNVPVSLPPLPSSGISSRISAEHAYT